MAKKLNTLDTSYEEEKYFSKYSAEELIQFLRIIFKEADEREKHKED